MQDFRDLVVWQKSHSIVLEIYSATKEFPREETYGLVSQIRRSAYSIATNIAEGSGRGSGPDFVRFLRISTGSASELDYQLLLAHDLGYIPIEQFHRLNARVMEVKRMLIGLIKSIQNSDG